MTIKTHHLRKTDPSTFPNPTSWRRVVEPQAGDMLCIGTIQVLQIAGIIGKGSGKRRVSGEESRCVLLGLYAAMKYENPSGGRMVEELGAMLDVLDDGGVIEFEVQ